VVRESSKALDYEAAAGLDGGSSIVSNDSMRELEELLTKLNPLAKEFVPPSHSNASSAAALAASIPKQISRRNGNNGGSRKRGSNSRTNRAQREDSIRRTVYVSDIDQQVTEEQLAALFITCGQVVDCRVCGDPNSVLRFAFVEFTDEGNNVCVTFQKHNGYDEAIASRNFLLFKPLALKLSLTHPVVMCVSA
jgi:hypothetical protein